MMCILSRISTIIFISAVTSIQAFAANVSISPSSFSVQAGETFTLEILISDVVDLYGFQFDIGFDPTVLAANSINEGTFLSSSGATLYLDGGIDNSAGTISNTANSLNGATAGVTGTGILASVSFTSLATGSSNINLYNPIFLNTLGSDIGIDNIKSSIVSVASVPIPSAVWLFGWASAGLAVLTGGKSSRSRKLISKSV